MSDYDVRAREAARRGLKPKSQGGKGQAVKLVHPPGSPAYDTATGKATIAAPTMHDCCGVEEAYSAHSIAAGLVLAGDVKFLMSALDVRGKPIPAPVADSDMLQRADGTWSIKRVDSLQPGGLAVMFTLQLRRN